MMSAHEATVVIGKLVAAYPVPNWPTETIKLFVIELAESYCEFEPSKAAMRQWYLTRKERPSLQEILHTCAGATHQAREARRRAAERRESAHALPSPSDIARNKDFLRDIVRQISAGAQVTPVHDRDRDMAPVKVDRAPTPEEEQRRTLLRTQAKQVAGS